MSYLRAVTLNYRGICGRFPGVGRLPRFLDEVLPCFEDELTAGTLLVVAACEDNLEPRPLYAQARGELLPIDPCGITMPVSTRPICDPCCCRSR